MKLNQIITSLLETDLYKFSMGQTIYHQFTSYKTTWTFKCRNNDVFFSPEMVEEIKEQIKDYIEDTAKLREENAQLKAEIEKLNEEKKLLLNSKKTMIASAVEIKHEVKEENTEEPASEISADDDLSFEDKLNKFKQVSDERMHDIKHSFESKRGTSRRGGNKY